MKEKMAPQQTTKLKGTQRCRYIQWSWIWNVQFSMTKRITLPSIFYKVIVTQCEYCIYRPMGCYFLLQACRKDRHCGQGSYCHKHNGLCHACKPIELPCRRNNMCCGGMECVFGFCRTALPRGTKGARCRKDRKCDAGLCCVKVHGEPICRQLLQEGDDCSVPEGGLGYALNQKCPCAAGLTCKKVKHRHRKR